MGFDKKKPTIKSGHAVEQVEARFAGTAAKIEKRFIPSASAAQRQILREKFLKAE